MSLPRSIATICTVLLVIWNLSTQAQPSTKQALESIAQTPEIAGFFSGIFNDLGITIEETGEQLTLHHQGDKITIEEGMDPSKVDFVLPLALKNISNLKEHSEDGSFDEVEATKIARVFFTPFTEVTLKNPVLSENKKRKAAGIEDLIHVYLLFPDGSTAASHTLIYVADQWLVIDGIVGKAKREFRLKQGPAMDYQRHVFHAMQVDTRKEWLNFLKWYKAWRKEYSTTPH